MSIKTCFLVINSKRVYIAPLAVLLLCIYIVHPFIAWRERGLRQAELCQRKTMMKNINYVSRSSGLAKIILQGTVKRKEKEADRRRDGMTISTSGQGRTLSGQLGQLNTGQDRKGLVRIHLWCPDDLQRLWDRIE